MKAWKNVVLAVLVSFSTLFFSAGCGKKQVIKEIDGSNLLGSFSNFVTNVKILKERPFVDLQTPKFIKELAYFDQYWTLGVPRNIPDDRRALKENFMKAAGNYCDLRNEAIDNMRLIKASHRASADWYIIKQEILSLISQGNQVMKNGEEEIGKGRKLIYRRLLRIAKELEMTNRDDVWKEVEKIFWEVHFSQ